MLEKTQNAMLPNFWRSLYYNAVDVGLTRSAVRVFVRILNHSIR